MRHFWHYKIVGGMNRVRDRLVTSEAIIISINNMVLFQRSLQAQVKETLWSLNPTIKVLRMPVSIPSKATIKMLKTTYIELQKMI